MYSQKRTDRDGNTYYSFVYTDAVGKRARLAKDEHPHFTDKQSADDWARSQSGVLEARKAYIARKTAWKTQYYKFDELLSLYEAWQKKRAVNSWKSSMIYLEQWVFAFFLTEKQLGNVNTWHLYFREFRDWLERPDAQERRGRKGPLAASTINNIVKALNGFLSCLLDYNKIDIDAVKKCPALPDHKLNRRTFKDVISKSEMEAVAGRLKYIYPPAADFFTILWHTGMRFSELFGLPITAIHKGAVKNRSLSDELEKCKISYVGYLLLDSQPFNDDRKREDDKSLKRKPLKSCKSIDPKYSRIIPLRTDAVWNIMARRYKLGLAAHFKKDYTADKGDYVFFEDCEWNKTVNALKQAYTDLGMVPKGYHSCRHSFVTLLVGETRSFFLTRTITGHRKDQSFERYLHIFEQMALEAEQAQEGIEVI